MANRQDTITVRESGDFAALGSRRPAPQGLDTSVEVEEVINAMPRWVARGLLYVVVGFVAAALLWAGLGRVDVTVEARGALVPEGYARPVQAPAGGVVERVFAREGERVEAGQPIAQLDAAELRTRLSKLREEIATSREQLRRLTVTGPVAETLEQQNRVARLEGERASVETALRETTVTAPASGVITRLEVRAAGAVVQPGQLIAAIAPEDTPLVVEARVPNKDIALVETGLPVKLKFDAFPFQDYGAVDGRTTYVSPDAQAGDEDGSFYKVTIVPERASVRSRGRDVPLRPGMAVTAEIVTERKSILSLLLEPFRKLKGEIEG